MTLFLASVRDSKEAAAALEHGADIIDAKDPDNGALGALDVEAVRGIVTAIGGRRPVSAVLGEAATEPSALVAGAEAMIATGVSHLKVGLFPGADHGARIAALAPFAKRVALIGVLFADADPDIELVGRMAAAGFGGVMIDTADKGAGRLLAHLDLPTLAGWVEAARAHAMKIGLAGSLEVPDIPRLLPLGPDILGFRGALCGGRGRTGSIDPAAVADVRALIPITRATIAGSIGGSGRPDYRLLAARLLPTNPNRDGHATDRLFVRDLVLDVRIGAYGFEREKPQRVRFNVDCDLDRLDHVPAHMRDVVSYDLITDGIAMIVAAEHIDFVETLAERVAAVVLAHRRVRRVSVRVEKLDLRPGSVGIEIVRERADEADNVHPLFASLEAKGPRAS